MTKGEKEIFVEVACVWCEQQLIVSLTMPAGTMAREAALQAGLSEEFPDLDPARAPLAIFGAEVADTHVLNSGDRVDLLRPLQRDPRDARRELAARGKTISAKPEADEA